MRPLCFLAAFILVGTVNCFSQKNFLRRFYVGASGSVRADFSQATGDLQVFRKTPAAIGWDASARIGYQLTEKLFIESGFGQYNTAHAFSLESNVGYGTSYRNRVLRRSWLYIPVRAAYTMYSQRGFTVASVLGCNIIANGKFPRHIPYTLHSAEPLVIKDGWGNIPPQPAVGFFNVRESTDFAALLYSGFRARLEMGAKWSLAADAGLSFGLRQINGGSFAIVPLNIGPGDDFGGRYSTFKGDALGMSVGAYYSLGK